MNKDDFAQSQDLSFVMCIRLYPKDRQKLDKLAKKVKIPRSKLVRKILMDYVEANLPPPKKIIKDNA